VGAPSNFDRILDLYAHDHKAITRDITAYRYTDEEIKRAIIEVHQKITICSIRMAPVPILL